jgi:hypothetical protein
MTKKTVLVPNRSASLLITLADEVHGDGDDLNIYKLAYLRNFKHMPSYHLK